MYAFFPPWLGNFQKEAPSGSNTLFLAVVKLSLEILLSFLNPLAMSALRAGSPTDAAEFC